MTSASQNETRLETWISHTPGQANLLKKHYYYIYRYYYSWICHYGRSFYNGALIGSGKEEKIIWYDTYPFEFCEFILDKALSTGTYLQALSANDAFYNRETSHIDNGGEVIMVTRMWNLQKSFVSVNISFVYIEVQKNSWKGGVFEVIMVIPYMVNFALLRVVVVQSF